MAQPDKKPEAQAQPKAPEKEAEQPKQQHPEVKPEPQTLSEAQKQTAKQPDKKPEPREGDTQGIPVVATRRGFYGRELVSGDKFNIRKERDFSARWMRPANAAAAAQLGVDEIKPAAEDAPASDAGKAEAPTGEKTVI